MPKAKVQCLPATHRETGDRTILTPRENRIGLLDKRDDIGDQIFLKDRKRWRRRKDIPFGFVVLLRTAIGHHDNDIPDFASFNEVVEEHIDCGEALPLSFISADSVKEVENGILFILGVARWRVNVELPLRTHGCRGIGNRCELARWRARVPLGDIRWWLRECLKVISCKGNLLLISQDGFLMKSRDGDDWHEK